MVLAEGEQEWIVVLECAGREGQAPIEELTSVLGSLAPLNASGLPGPDRYAVQVHVVTTTAPDAVQLATTRWEEALNGLGLPPSGLVRAEVLTSEQFEWECDNELVTNPPAMGLVAGELLRHHLEYTLASAGDDRTVALILVEADPRDDPQRVAGRLERLLRSGDVVARMSGSVFALLLEDTSEEVVTAVSERIAAGVATGGPHPAVAFALSQPGDHGDLLIARAENALHRAGKGATGPGRRRRPSP